MNSIRVHCTSLYTVHLQNEIRNRSEAFRYNPTATHRNLFILSTWIIQHFFRFHLDIYISLLWTWHDRKHQRKIKKTQNYWQKASRKYTIPGQKECNMSFHLIFFWKKHLKLNSIFDKNGQMPNANVEWISSREWQNVILLAIILKTSNTFAFEVAIGAKSLLDNLWWLATRERHWHIEAQTEKLFLQKHSSALSIVPHQCPIHIRKPHGSYMNVYRTRIRHCNVACGKHDEK